MSDLIDRQTALDAIDAWRREYPLDLQEPIDDCWNSIRELPAVQPDHNADIGKKAEGDCISRQAAIDALDCINGVEEVLRALPSAQPEIIRCKDCKHRHVENMVWTCPFGLSGGGNFFCGYGTEPYKGE